MHSGPASPNYRITGIEDRRSVDGAPGPRNQNLADSSGKEMFEYAAGCSVILSSNFQMVD